MRDAKYYIDMGIYESLEEYAEEWAGNFLELNIEQAA